jgi:hypothetical protein
MTLLSQAKTIEAVFHILSIKGVPWVNSGLAKVYSENQDIVRSWRGHSRLLYKIKGYSRFLVGTELFYRFPEWVKSQGVEISLIPIDAEWRPEKGERIYELCVYYPDGREGSSVAQRQVYDDCASDEENAKNRIDDLLRLGIPAGDMFYFVPVKGGEKIFAFKAGSGYYAIE